MKSLFALAGLSAAALTLAACGQPAEKPADAAVLGTVTVAALKMTETPVDFFVVQLGGPLSNGTIKNPV